MSTAVQTPEAIVAAAQSARAESVEEYHGLARRVASGESIDPAELGRVSAAAGLAIDENPNGFAQLVERYQYRARLRQRHSELGVVEAEMKDIRAKVDEENRILEEHVQEHQRLTAPLQRRLKELRQTFGEIHNISTELIASNPRADLRKKLRASQTHLEALAWQRMRAVDKATEFHGRSAATQNKAERIHAERLAIESDGQVKKLEAEIARGEAAQASLTAEILAL